MTMNINLTPQLEELVRAKVSSGLYNSASEVMREALRLMEREDELRAAKLARLKLDIEDGLNSGPARLADEAFASLEAKYQAMAQARGEAQ